MLSTSDSKINKINAEPNSLAWIEVAEEFEYILFGDIMGFLSSLKLA